MSGILDTTFDPNTVGLLSLASGLLQAGGPQRTPVSFGQALGQGINQGIQGYTGAEQGQLQRLLLGAQVNQAARQQAMQEAFAKQLGISLPNNYGPAALNSPAMAQAPQASAPSVQPPAMGGAPGAMDQTQAPNPIATLPPQFKGAALSDLAFNQGKGLGNILVEAGKPTVGRAGAPIYGYGPDGKLSVTGFVPQSVPGVDYQFGPNGRVQSAAAVPGFAGAEADVAGAKAGAEAAARAEHETINVKLADGREVPVLKSVVAGWPVPAQTAVKNDKPVTPASTDPWANIPKLSNPQGMGQSTYNEKTASAQAESAAKLSDKFGTVAQENNQRLAINNQALSLIDKSDTGPGAATIADVKNILVSRIGVPESDFENTPSATQALQKDLLNAATQRAKQQFGSRMTQSEVMLMLKRGAPNVDMTKAAMKYLIQSDNTQLQYGIKQSNDLGRYLSSGGDPYQFEGWYAKNFPLANPMGQVHLNTGTPNIDDLLKKYGKP